MKAEFLDQIYVIPERLEDGGECPSMADVIAFAKSVGAIPCYAYLGDVTASPTGDKKAEKFEDDFLEELFSELERMGMPAITYMPPRNTAEQMARVAELAAVFNCPELQRPELAHLNDATWAMVAHEQLANESASLGLFSPDSPLAVLRLTDRVARYGALGRALVAGETTVEESVSQLRRALA